MKILHVNTHERQGGAAIAAYRLHKGMQTVGLNSEMAVANKGSDDLSVYSLYGKMGKALRPFLRFPDFILPKLYRSRLNTYFSPELRPSFIHNAIRKDRCDIINLHWIAQSFLPPSSLARLTSPVVWTLHDTWAFTGGCHILTGCEMFKEKCGKCKQLGSRSHLDISRATWFSKKRAYRKIIPNIVTPSRYLYEKASSSSLLKGYSINHIPNGISTQTFRPVPKQWARSILNLPLDSKIVAFGAMSATSDPNKGSDLLLAAMNHLKATSNSDIQCLIFGASHSAELPFPTHYMGALHDEVTINLAYNAADVFICPSREENLPNTVLESLACGTPVVGFYIGGIPDMVMHLKNGYLVRPYDTKMLARGVMTILADEHQHQIMSDHARTSVEEKYAIELIAQRYRRLYEEVLEKKN